MNLPAEIKTIKESADFKLKEKGSLFIAVSEPILEEAHALTILSKVRKKYDDATHHCYSFKLQNGNFKYSDDGEPGGTAGIRIYNAQNRFDLTNLITIVIRYYGGTKLGVGPLGKAYYDAAFECLKNSIMEQRLLYRKIVIVYDFTHSKTLHHFVSKFKVVITKNEFDDRPKVFCLIQPTQIDTFSNELLKATQNKLEIKRTDEFSYLTSNSN